MNLEEFSAECRNPQQNIYIWREREKWEMWELKAKSSADNLLFFNIFFVSLKSDSKNQTDCYHSVVLSMSTLLKRSISDIKKNIIFWQHPFFSTLSISFTLLLCLWHFSLSVSIYLNGPKFVFSFLHFIFFPSLLFYLLTSSFKICAFFFYSFPQHFLFFLFLLCFHSFFSLFYNLYLIRHFPPPPFLFNSFVMLILHSSSALAMFLTPPLQS